jgi:hypothetical protein
MFKDCSPSVLTPVATLELSLLEGDNDFANGHAKPLHIGPIQNAIVG